MYFRNIRLSQSHENQAQTFYDAIILKKRELKQQKRKLKEVAFPYLPNFPD